MTKTSAGNVKQNTIQRERARESNIVDCRKIHGEPLSINQSSEPRSEHAKKKKKRNKVAKDQSSKVLLD